MTRTAGPLFACALALISAQASAQAGATTPALGHPEVDQKAVPSEPQRPTANPPTADDVCRTLEEAAAENGLPVEFFARVIWQESRFNAQAVSPKGAARQFMPQTAGWHGRSSFDPRALAFGAYLPNCETGGNPAAAAACNAGPGRVSVAHAIGPARRDAQLRGNRHRLDQTMGIRAPPRRRTRPFPQGYLVLGSPI
jgi:soluble lytic murein transglycosylase-like protein